MKEYVLYSLEKDKYTAIIIGLTYVSPLSNIEKIEHELKRNCPNGLILFDQLLQTGNSKNRYLEFNISDGQIIISSAKNVLIDKKEKYRQIAMEILRQNEEALNNSILNNEQIKLIKQGCVI